MERYLKIISPFVIILSVLSLFLWRSLPASKLWNEYAVVYVPSGTPDALVQEALSYADIQDAVFMSGQFLPVDISTDSIEYSLYRYNADSPDFAYVNGRNAYFFDKNNDYRLYYIPANEKNKINELLSFLSGNGIKGGADTSASYPWILPVIVIFLAAALALFSKNKAFFLTAAVLPVITIFCNPFYQMAEALCLVILCLFFISNVWQRKGAVSYLLANKALPAMVVLAFICAFTCSIKAGFMFLFSIMGTVATVYVFYFVQIFLRSRRSFVPVYIRPAKKISIFNSKLNLVMPVTCVCSLIILVVVLLSSVSEPASSSSARLQLPANAQVSAQLPQLEDYYRWMWNFKTNPYKSLNVQNAGDTFVEYPKFVEDNGVIRQTSMVMAYNQSFKDSVFESIDLLPYNAIEQVLKSEGKDFSGGYAATNSYTIGTIGIIMSLICVFVLLFFYISTIMRRGSKR